MHTMNLILLAEFLTAVVACASGGQWLPLRRVTEKERMGERGRDREGEDERARERKT
jgi:hypothetical protein